jgi:predicted transcriptional regulator
VTKLPSCAAVFCCCLPAVSQTLGSRNILSAPVLDEDGEYFGCLSVNDLLKSLYKGERRLLCNSHAVQSSTAVFQTSTALASLLS